ncbi:MAG: multiheme c-type cytochrome [Terriglobia bacterium]
MVKPQNARHGSHHLGFAYGVLAVVFCLLVPGRLCGQSAITANFPRSNWQPTQAPSGARYVGDMVCAQCHLSEARFQEQTAMAHALESVATCRILHAHPNLTHRIGRYTYRIVTQGSGSIYSVSDGTAVFSVPILYAFGQGQAGQTYVYRQNGAYYESRVSFYSDTQSLDMTLGYHGGDPGNVEEAAGRRTSAEDARDCFSCHSTAAVRDGQLQVDHLMPGITCEGCHGAGAAHVEAIKKGDLKSPNIFNPGRLSTQDLSDFCGSCHRSWQQVEMMNLEGIQDVRFQPYRLENSRCFDATNPRIRCLACHNPHHEVRTDAAFYDSKCLACHRNRGMSLKLSAARTAPACPVSQKNCVTCHMPKYELPGAHFKFTDHYIRIVRAGAPYPY